MASIRDLDAAQLRIAAANSGDFAKLIELSGIDPKQDLRYWNWSGLSFKGCDLRGFDFRAARLIGCDFTNALIEGACFEQTVMDVAGRDNFHIIQRQLSKSADFEKFVASRPEYGHCESDRNFHRGDVFQDAPSAPEMIVIPAGEFVFERKTIRIEQSFAVGRTRVTMEAPFRKGWWQRRFAQSERSEAPLRPADMLAWRFSKIDDYLTQMQRYSGIRYRLISADEWVYISQPKFAEHVQIHCFSPTAADIEGWETHLEWIDGHESEVLQAQTRSDPVVAAGWVPDTISARKPIFGSWSTYQGKSLGFRVARDLRL